MQNLIRISLLPLVATLILSLAGVTYAEDGSAETSVTVGATTSRSKPRPTPLQVMQEKKARLLENARSIRQNLRGDLQEERAETRVELRAATSGPERRDIIKGSLEDRKEVRADARAEIKGNIKERLQALIKTHVGSIIRRLGAAFKQFDNIIERIDSRIQKLKQRGVDTSSVEASLSTSASLVATAKENAGALSTLVGSVSESSDAASVKEQLRTATDKATASVKAAHRALLETAKMLSAIIRASASVESSSSTEEN